MKTQTIDLELLTSNDVEKAVVTLANGFQSEVHSVTVDRHTYTLNMSGLLQTYNVHGVHATHAWLNVVKLDITVRKVVPPTMDDLFVQVAGRLPRCMTIPWPKAESFEELANKAEAPYSGMIRAEAFGHGIDRYNRCTSSDRAKPIPIRVDYGSSVERQSLGRAVSLNRSQQRFEALYKQGAYIPDIAAQVLFKKNADGTYENPIVEEAFRGTLSLNKFLEQNV